MARLQSRTNHVYFSITTDRATIALLAVYLLLLRRRVTFVVAHSAPLNASHHALSTSPCKDGQSQPFTLTALVDSLTAPFEYSEDDSPCPRTSPRTIGQIAWHLSVKMTASAVSKLALFFFILPRVQDPSQPRFLLSRASRVLGDLDPPRKKLTLQVDIIK